MSRLPVFCIVFVIILTACGGVEAQQPVNQHGLPYNIQDCLNPPPKPSQPLNDNSIFRAATVPVYTWRSGYGHGFIIETAGQLYLASVEHVLSGALNECAYYSVPNSHNTSVIDPNSATSSWDGAWWFSDNLLFFSMGEYEAILRNMIAQGELIPLYPSKNINIGDWVAIPSPETGRNTILQVIDVTSNEIWMSSNAGAVCQGRSGGPILLVTNNQITNLVVGSAKEIQNGWEDSTGRKCSDNIVIGERIP